MANVVKSEGIVLDKRGILESAKESYYDAQEAIIALTKEIQSTETEVSVKRQLIAFDGLLQLIMVNVAAQDGMFLKVEKDFIAELCDYADVMQLANISWDVFLRLDQAALKTFITEINEKTVGLFTSAFACFYELNWRQLLRLEVSVANICHCLASVDGDTKESPDYIREWGAGMKIFDKVFKKQPSNKMSQKPIFYGFDRAYDTEDITVQVVSVEYDDCWVEHFKIFFKICNKQHRKVRLWFKDVGIWSYDASQELYEDYIFLTEIEGYGQETYCHIVEDDLFETLHLNPYYVECALYDKNKCCSDLIFTLTYDFGEDFDVGISQWILDSMEFEIVSQYEENSNGTAHQSSKVDDSLWNAESTLRRAGYTVSQREGLTDNERQRVLSHVIESGLMSVNQVIKHIEAQINLRKSNPIYYIALSKWERDLEFLRKVRDEKR